MNQGLRDLSVIRRTRPLNLHRCIVTVPSASAEIPHEGLPVNPVYEPLFSDIRERLGHALNVYKFSFEEALGYTVVECSLLDDSNLIYETLNFLALVKVALELGCRSKLLADYFQQHCGGDRATAALNALMSDEDREAVVRDLADARAALVTCR